MRRDIAQYPEPVPDSEAQAWIMLQRLASELLGACDQAALRASADQLSKWRRWADGQGLLVATQLAAAHLLVRSMLDSTAVSADRAYPDEESWLAHFELARDLRAVVEVPFACVALDRGEGRVLTLELRRCEREYDERFDRSEFVCPHPCNRLARVEADSAFEEAMRTAGGLAKRTIDFLEAAKRTTRVFWRVPNISDAGAPCQLQGASAGGSAFFGMAHLLRKQTPRANVIVLAKAGAHDLAPFSEESELKALELKAQAIAGHPRLDEIRVASRGNAQRVYHALGADARIKVTYPGARVDA